MSAKNNIVIPSLIFVAICISIGALCISHIDLNHLQPLMKMNDVPSIIDGYHKTPHLLADGLKWWHGAWIETGIGAYRPLSSYLLWSESYIVLRYGFIPIVVIGAILMLVICIACALVSWQLTHSHWASLFGGILGALVTRFNYGGIDGNWIAWYPVHHDLLNIALALYATWAFLVWMEKGERTYLLACWVFFITGLLTKEYLYIFPLMALATVTFYKSTFTSRKKFLYQPALMLATIAVLYAFRQSVISIPYTPHPLTKHMLITHSLLFWFHAFYLYLPISDFMFPSIALLAFISAALVPLRNKWITIASIIILLCFVQLTYGIIDFVWYLIDAPIHANLLIQMIFTFYTFYLCYKYRKTHNGLLAYALMMVAYLPTFTYLGWHYSLSGWFFRSAAFWPVIAAMVFSDIRGLANDYGWRISLPVREGA